jgi:hypothetical protein
MTFGLTPPKNVTNLFWNWFKEISKKNDLVKIRVGVCAIIWTLWNTRNNLIFNKSKKKFTGYSYGYPMDLYVVLSSTRGATKDDRFWVQSFENGSLRFIQAVRPAVA